MNLGKMLNWNEPKPQVGKNIRKIKTRFQPTGWFSGGASAQPNQYLRFDFNTDGLWDPRSLYCYIELNTLGMPADCIYQLDNSAQSLIGQFISRVRGVELERVQEYDALAAMLYDLNIGITERDAKAMEGVGTNRTTYQTMQTRASESHQPFEVSANVNYGSSNAFVNYLNTSVTPVTYSAPTPTNISNIISFSNVCGSFKPYIGMKMYMSDSELVTNVSGLKPYNNQSGGVLQLPFLMNYIDMYNCNDIEGHECYFNSQDTSNAMLSNHGQAYLRVNDYGHTRMTQTSVGTGEWWASTTIPKNTIKTGLPCYETSAYGNFCIPLLSTLFGSVSTHGKLLPMQAFQGLEFEFLLNPYAFFTGGNSTVACKHNGATSYNIFPPTTTSTYDPSKNLFASTSGSQIQPRTGWQITKFEIVVDVYYLDKPSEENYLNKLNNEGFMLDLKQWYLGPKVKYADGSSLNQTVQINNGFNSLCALAFYFQPADYELYPWCRKQKRISNNLTSIQLRIGNEYFPSLPIVGHAGNIRPDYLSSTVKGNYSEFYINTMQTFGKFYDMKDTTLLNASNFCTNHVGYNPTAFATGNLNANNDVFLGSSLFFENNHVPRNIFALDLEKIDLTGNIRSGWDTTGTRPFDLLLNNDASPVTIQTGPITSETGGVITNVITATAFPRPVYLVIWCLYDSRISWNPMEGWKSEGRV